jgi:hypothetical protein
VLDILASRRVILVLQAHLHKVEAVRRDGTTFLTGGAISGQWWQTRPRCRRARVRGRLAARRTRRLAVRHVSVSVA